MSFATAPSGTYAVIVAVFCGLLLISNIAATKTITVVDGLPAAVGERHLHRWGRLSLPAHLHSRRRARRGVRAAAGEAGHLGGLRTRCPRLPHLPGCRCSPTWTRL